MGFVLTWTSDAELTTPRSNPNSIGVGLTLTT